MAKYYAVKVGNVPGIYETWDECQKQVKGYPGAIYKSFSSEKEAKQFLEKNEKIKEERPQKTSQPIKKGQDGFMKSSLTKDQQMAYDYMMKGENVFLTGEAGTGKSFVINHFIEVMKEKNKNVLVCAPTGIAAINVGGVTIHRSFQASLEPQVKLRIDRVPETIKEADIIIIDEISMCRIDLFDYVIRVIMKAEQISLKRKQVIVVGDFFQLPPVTTESDFKVLSQIYPNYDKGFAFESKNWHDFDFKMVELKNVMRQNDNAFIKALNQIRVGNKEGIAYFNHNATRSMIDKGIILCATNKVANKINQDELDKIKTRATIFKAKIVGEVKDSDKPTMDEVRLKIGARVIILINDTEMNRFQNGSLGTVMKISKQGVDVELDQTSEIVTFGEHEWVIEDYTLEEERVNGVLYKKVEKEKIGSFTQIPLKLAYAITIHKSQGQTYDKVNLIPYSFDCGQLYVALSRVKSIEGLCLIQRMRQEDLICNSLVKDFYHVGNDVDKNKIYIEFAKKVLDMKEIHEMCPDILKEYIYKTLNSINGEK